MTDRTVTLSDKTLHEALGALWCRAGEYRQLAELASDAGVDEPRWTRWANESQEAYEEIIRELRK